MSTPAFPTITLPRNYEFGHNFNSQDLRLTKSLRWKDRVELQMFGEGFNILNIANVTGYSNNLLSPSFGQPSIRRRGHHVDRDRGRHWHSRNSRHPRRS